MHKGHDYTGRRFGRLTAIEDVGSAGRLGRMWLCRCDCGGEKDVPVQKLLAGLRGKGISSCGCKVRDGSRQRHPAYTHWKAMRQRCRDIPGYADVSVCPEWEDSKAFLEWAERSGFEPGLSLDRIDPYGNYEPSNCRWITLADQSRNKRRTFKVEWRGRIVPLSVACKQAGVNYWTALSRFRAGRPDNEVLEGGRVERLPSRSVRDSM